MSRSPLIISVSGLRGVVGDSLTPYVAMRYAAALAAELAPGPIVLTRDGRTTGVMLRDAVCAALTGCGRNVFDADIAATPTTGVLVQKLHAAGGIQISASHNPPQYNGLKLFNAEGRVIPASAGERVLQRYQQEGGCEVWATYERLGATERVLNANDEHLRRILTCVDVERIRASAFHVLLDANHGSGSVLGVPLLESLGCRITLLGGDPDGRFAHVPEPTAENLASVVTAIVRARCVVGFCQDPDADRLAVIDEQGRYLGEEYTLAMCADHILRQRTGPVVTNCSTSRMTEDIAHAYGVPFARARVGEANVVDAMLAQGALLGGEGNGGVIDPRVGLVRDSFIGMALVLDAMAARQLPVSELADALPRYAIHKAKIDMPSGTPSNWERVASAMPDARASHLDGLRLDWPDGAWLLVRGSNTEPIVRLIAEASTADRAADLCAKAGAVLREQ